MFLRLCCCCLFITIVAGARCPDCQPSLCPPLNCNNTYIDQCGCCAVCARTIGQRCGGILNHWGSCGPGLKCVYRLGNVYNRERFGFCEKTFCSVRYCGFRQHCIDQDVFCKCYSYDCSTNLNKPVCGNDFVTYSNLCHLYKIECESISFIGVQYKGPCGHKKTDIASFRAVNITIYKVDECYFNRKVYNVGHKIDIGDPCSNVICATGGALLALPIPGCGANVPDSDFTK